ncbi:MAG: antitoxin of toxin-antitoxin stability system, partial [Candidatus Accumulibacter sp.]|nr:antitoxin of toxin-antitoxin stability system [Accumulibacter sp.]
VICDLMRSYIEQRRQAREYDDYLRCKVETARADIAAGRVHSNDEIETKFSTARDELLRQAEA